VMIFLHAGQRVSHLPLYTKIDYGRQSYKCFLGGIV